MWSPSSSFIAILPLRFTCTKSDSLLRRTLPDTDVRVFKGRDSTGVRGINLAKGDRIISMTILRHFEVWSPSSSFIAILPLRFTCTKSDSLLRRTLPDAVANIQCIRFPVTDVRVFKGRDSTGVRGINLAKGDRIISMSWSRSIAAAFSSASGSGAAGSSIASPVARRSALARLR
jgi:DNA gyrase/topoisomerase IV subunit A